MQPLILHLMWHPHRTAAVGPFRNDILLQCAALSPRVEPYEQHEVFVDLTGTHSVDAAISALLSAGDAPQPQDAPFLALTLAPNKFVARTASLLAVERALSSAVHVRHTAHALCTHVEPSQVQRFLEPLSVYSLWCVSHRVCQRLAELGIAKIGELRRVPRHRLTHAFGREVGERLLALANGCDPSVVQPLYPARTVEVYWDFGPEHVDYDMGTFTHALHHLADELAFKLSELGLACSSLLMRMELPTGTVGYGINLRSPTCTPEGLRQHTERLFQRFVFTDAPYRIHLVAGDLDLPRNVQASLFSEQGRSLITLRADKVLAGVQKRFGTDAIQYASALRSLRRERMRALWHGAPR